MKKPSYKSAFSLIEISIVVLVIGLIVAGIAQAGRLIQRSAINSARAQTKTAPVALIDDLVLWFETTAETSFLAADAKPGFKVSTWYNIAPTAFGKGSDGLQSTDANKPLYREKRFNNLPVLEFNGTTSYFNLPNGSFPYSNTPFSVFFVGISNTTAASGGVVIGTGGGGTISAVRALCTSSSSCGINLKSTADVSATDSSASTLTAGKQYVAFVSYDGTATSTSTKFYINGAPMTISSGTPAGITSTRDDVVIGGGPNFTTAGAGYFNGSLAEIIVYRRALKNDERKDIENYLAKKWKIKAQ